jgi:hypothetical protein
MILSKLFLVLIGLTIFCSSCRPQSIDLEGEDMLGFLSQIDTLPGQKNYHIWLTPNKPGEYYANVWINNRLGGTSFAESGLSICDYFSFKEGLVFVYELRDCEVRVPVSSLEKQGQGDYDYLRTSPFHEEEGFKASFLLKKENGVIKVARIEEVDNSILKEPFLDVFGG